MKKCTKQILSILLAVLMTTVLIPPTISYAADDVVLTVLADKSSVEVGETITYTLSLSGITPEDKLSGIGFKIVLPAGLTLNSGSATIDSGFASATGWATNMTAFDETPFFMFSGFGDIYNGTTLALGTFACTASSTGSQEITFDAIEILTDMVAEITTTPITATVNVTPVITKITDIDVALTVPAKGDTAEAIVIDTGYSGTVVWSPNDATFKAGTVYTATVTLAANTASDYAFNVANNADLKINGEAVTSVSSKSNTEIVFTKEFPETSAKTSQTISFTSVPSSVTYGDTGLSVAATGGAGIGAITYAVTSGDALSVDSTTGALTIIKAGSATVTATKAADDDYTAANVQIEITVEKIDLTGGSAAATNREYDATTSVDVVISGVSGILVGDAGAVSVTASGTIADANVESGKAVAISNIQVTGAKSANYNPPSSISNTTVDITKAAGLMATGTSIYIMEDDVGAKSDALSELISISKLDAGNITYTLGVLTGDAAIFSAVPAISSSNLTYTHAAGKTAGQAAQQVINVVSQNYADTTATIVFDITAKTPVTITPPASLSKIYDGTPLNVSAISSTPVSALNITYSGTADDGTVYADSAAAPVKAGSYTVTAKVPDSNATYTGTATFNFTIAKAQITLKADDKAIRVGDAEPNYTYTASGLVAPDTWNSVRASETDIDCPTIDVNTVGLYPLIISGAALNTTSGANYSLQYANGMLTISDKSAECDITDVITPVRAKISGTSISASVSNNTESVVVELKVSAGATWRMYSDLDCTNEITGNVMMLEIGQNMAYINVVAENGSTSKVFAITIMRASNSAADDSSDDDNDSYNSSGNKAANTVNQNESARVLVTAGQATTQTNAAVENAKAQGLARAIVSFKNVATITKDVLQSVSKAAGMPVQLQVDSMTTDGKAVDVRISINPAETTKDVNLSGSTMNATAKDCQSFFEKWFSNDITVVSLGQKSNFEIQVKIAAKIDISKMDISKLVLYRYNKETNTYTRIQNANYWVDKNGYIHFTTELAGDIVISEGVLIRK